MDGSSLTHSDPFVYKPALHTKTPPPPPHPPHSVPSPSHFLSYALSHHNMQFSYWLLGLSIHSVRQSKGGPVCGFRAYATMYLFVCELAFSLHHYMSLSYSTPGHYFSLFHSLFSTPLTLPMLLSFSPTPQISGALPEPHINS